MGSKGETETEIGESGGRRHANTDNGKRTDAEAFPGPLHHITKGKKRIYNIIK